MKKTILLLVISVFFYNYRSLAQKNICEIHLSYNVLSSSHMLHKFVDKKNNRIDFYIGKESFECDNNRVKRLSIADIKDIEIVTLDTFQDKAFEIRLNSINIEEEEIYYIPKNEYFKKIFLYEKIHKDIFMYEVTWVNEVID